MDEKVTVFGLDFGGLTTNKCALVRADRPDPKLKKIYITIINKHPLSKESEERNLIKRLDKARYSFLKGNEKTPIYVDVPIDLQMLNQMYSYRHYWQLTHRPVDYVFRALAPLGNLIGVMVSAFRYLLTNQSEKLEEKMKIIDKEMLINKGLDKLFYETYPSISCYNLKLYHKKYKDTVAIYTNNTWRPAKKENDKFIEDTTFVSTEKLQDLKRMSSGQITSHIGEIIDSLDDSFQLLKNMFRLEETRDILIDDNLEGNALFGGIRDEYTEFIKNIGKSSTRQGSLQTISNKLKKDSNSHNKLLKIIFVKETREKFQEALLKFLLSEGQEIDQQLENNVIDYFPQKITNQYDFINNLNTCRKEIQKSDRMRFINNLNKLNIKTHEQAFSITDDEFDAIICSLTEWFKATNLNDVIRDSLNIRYDDLEIENDDLVPHGYRIIGNYFNPTNLLEDYVIILQKLDWHEGIMEAKFILNEPKWGLGFQHIIQ